MENIPDVIWTTTRNGRTVFISPRVEAVYGFTPEEIYRGGEEVWLGRIHPDDAKNVHAAFRALFEKGMPFDTEYRIQKKDGTWIWLHDRAITTYEQDGTWYADGIFTDITDKKQAEEQLKAEREKYRLLIVNSADIVTVLSPEGYIRYNSPVLESTLGYHPAELEEVCLFDLVHPEDKELIRKNMRIAEEKPGNIISAAFRIRHRNGSWRWLESHAVFTTLPEYGQVIIANSVDVTGRRESETALKESEERYRTLAEAALDPIFIIGQDDIVLYVNNRAALLLNRPAGQIIGKPRKSLFPPDIADRQGRNLRSVFTSGKPLRTEIRIAYGDNELWQDNSLVPLPDENGIVSAVLGISRDITQRKLAEEAIRESEKRFHAIFDAARDGILVADRETHRLVMSNAAIREMTGYSEGELLTFSISDLVRPEDLPRVIEQFEKQVLGEIHLSSDIPLQKKDGTAFYAEVNSSGFTLAGRQCQLGIFRDMTERLAGEEALRQKNEELARDKKALAESEERQKKLLDHLPVGVLVIDAADHTVIEANQKALELIGIPRSEVTGKVCHSFICPAEKGSCPISDLGQSVNNSERVLLTKERGRIPIMKTVIPLAMGGRPVLVETFFDISDRKRVESALRESELRYRTIFESSRDAIMTLEPPLWRFTSGNPAAVQMFMAQDEAEFISHGPWDLSPEFQPDGRESGEKAMKMIESAMQDGTRFFEWTHKRLNGKDFPATVLLSRIELAGKTFLQATVRDITKSKLAKEAIRKSEQKFHAIFDAARDGILIADTETHRFVMANVAITTLTGYSEEELLSLSIPDIHRPADLPYVIGEFERQSRGEIYLSSDIPVLRKDGTIIYADINSSSIVLQERECRLGIFRDVTERNEQEKKLKLLQEEKEILLRELHHRVGNILQMAVGMMRVRVRRESNEQVKTILLDTQIRLNAIAATFEKIYYSEDISRVDLQNVITAIVRFLKSTCGNTVQYVDIDIRINIRELGVDLALPLALITSELISNSLRHAFPDGRRGTISLTISEKSDGGILLSMSDDGRGLPAGINPADSDTIGFGLVRILTDQIGGKLDFSGGKSGTTITIHVPRTAESAKSRVNVI